MKYKTYKFPKTRLATIDLGTISRKKHYVAVLLECDVTDSRNKIRELKKAEGNTSFTSFLIKVIGKTLNDYKLVTAFKYKRRKIIVFDEIDISIVVEKEIDEQKVPIPLVIKNVCKKSLSEIYYEINEAKNSKLEKDNIIINQKSSIAERLYFFLPAFFRRGIFKSLLRFPKLAYKKMGNAVISNVGMFGQVDAWFIQSSIHPVSFAIGSVMKKPRVVNEVVNIREILNITVLLDHDVVDGVYMARFIKALNKNIEDFNF